MFYNSSFGFADDENKISFSNKTAFKIGEISELVTANIIRKMAIKDKFQLSDKISKYTTEIKSDLTINDLLNPKSNLAFESSDKHERNGLDYNSLGLLIEKISRKSFQENIEEYSKDLGLENTNFQKADSILTVGYLYHNYQGNGLELERSQVSNLENIFSSKGLKATAKDLAKVINSNSEKELAINSYLENNG